MDTQIKPSPLQTGNGFVFQKGALLRAMEFGYWFLADEFNLADPNVMSALVPILEGVEVFTVPGSDITISVDPKFKFFATQNDAKLFAGRNTATEPIPEHHIHKH